MANAVKTLNNLVDLLLTAEEADCLAAVLSRVAGSPTDSPRKHQQAVTQALQGIGLEYNKTDADGMLNGTLHFRDYPPLAPAFVPGYFKDSGDGDVQHFESQDELDGYGAEGEWQRVTVTLVP